MTIVICLYLIVGIITIVPCIVYGFVRDIDGVEEFENIDGWGLFGIGCGSVLAIIIWPYYIGYFIYAMIVRKHKS